MSGMHDIGAPFTLSDPEGRRVSLADFKGKLVLLYFGFATCPDVCPTDLALIAQALRQVGTEEVQPLFVTLDPERDSPEQMGNYIAAFGGDLIGLTGSTPEIVKATQTFGVAFARVDLAGGNYTMDHSATVFALDSDANIVAVFTPPLNAAALTRDLARLAPILGKS